MLVIECAEDDELFNAGALRRRILRRDGRPLRQCQIEAIKTMLESCYEDHKTKMPKSVSRILFDEQFNSLPAGEASTRNSIAINDAQRRIIFVKKLNTPLAKFSKKKEHLLPSVILQLGRLRFPEGLDSYNPPTSGYDVSLEEFVRWTKNSR
ncbi:unnamed protein product [Rotaria socialis]|uniref:Uncharacterized protein n=2 Tax=Rotaria socialis TaxID=392032 RepID=A0A821UB53_9BILA|nr:unnamed protein product [Rotaria socialis]